MKKVNKKKGVQQTGKNRLLSDIREFFTGFAKCEVLKEIKPLPCSKRKDGNWNERTVKTLGSDGRCSTFQFCVGRLQQTVIVYLQ